jgi:hypothetical protein
MEKINMKCPCPNHGCEYHGKCKECIKDHHGKNMYCKLPPWRKKSMIFYARFCPWDEE